jgi:uncharacterized protein (TIGR03437 family)
MTVTVSGATSLPYQVVIDELEPGLDAPPAFDVSGTQYVVGVLDDGDFALPAGAIAGVNTRPANPGENITFYGVGFGPVTPDTPAGQIAQGQTALVNKVTFSIGGAQATVTYQGLAPSLVGLYQFNVTVPQVTAGNAVPVTFTLNGTPGTQTLNIAVQ